MFQLPQTRCDVSIDYNNTTSHQYAGSTVQLDLVRKAESAQKSPATSRTDGHWCRILQSRRQASEGWLCKSSFGLNSVLEID